MLKKPLVIYHGNCQDGFTAAWCFWYAFGDFYEFYPGVYQQDPPDVAGRNVVFVDFSYKRPVIEKMLEDADSILILDHHKSAYEDLGDLEHPKLSMTFDMTHSGAYLAWKYCFSDDPPEALLHVEDRDLWKFKLIGTKEISAALFSYEYDFEMWTTLMVHTSTDELHNEGSAISRKHMKDVKELISVYKRQMYIGGYDVPVACLPYTHVSEAAHIMAQGVPFAACYWDTKDSRIFGLRSADDGLDVSKIAIKYGGGGHKHAAGFSVPRNHPLAHA